MKYAAIILAAGKGTRYRGTKQDVLFHDVVIAEAARSMVTRKQLLQLLHHSSPSISFANPLVNTVIFKNVRYINRDSLYDLLTPQAFD